MTILSRYVLDAPDAWSGLPDSLYERLAGALRARPYISAVALVSVTAVLLKLLEYMIDSRDLTVLFMIPIVFCAWKLGQGPALCASLLSILLSATFVFEPLFDPRVSSRHHLTHLIVFMITAVVAAKIAHDARRATASLAARHRETEALYGFSRRLANLSSPIAIYAAMREHLAAELGERLVLAAPYHAVAPPIGIDKNTRIPADVSHAIQRALEEPLPAQGFETRDPDDGSIWIIKPLQPENSGLGLIAVNIGQGGSTDIDARQHVDATLRDAVSRLERLDLDQALNDARLREKSEEFREALIGSVTHDLRTPISAIMGSASILSEAPPISQDEKLSGLSRLIASAAGDLDQKIANLINATRVSSQGIEPRLAWVDPTDIISSALRESAMVLGKHTIVRALPGEPPLIFTDPVLLKEVLRQFLDNAAKYASAESEITVRLTIEQASLLVAVEDHGAGMDRAEIDRAFERFFRGPTQIGKSAGTGLGLWIAQAFAQACGAQIRLASDGPGHGTTASLVVPLRAGSPAEEPDSTDG